MIKLALEQFIIVGSRPGGSEPDERGRTLVYLNISPPLLSHRFSSPLLPSSPPRRFDVSNSIGNRAPLLLSLLPPSLGIVLRIMWHIVPPSPLQLLAPGLRAPEWERGSACDALLLSDRFEISCSAGAPGTGRQRPTEGGGMDG